MTLPHGFAVRRIRTEDREGVLAVLAVLSEIGNITESQFAQQVKYWDSQFLDNRTHIYHPVVITDQNGVIAAVATLFLERKLIHECGIVGHIEDVAVSKAYQGRKLGQAIIQHLTALALKCKCYKVILDCNESNVLFYEKCGYKRIGVEMERRARL